MAKVAEDFYLRYYVGHKGKFGHEFLEFEFRPDGKLRYANNSNYKNDTMIRKEAYVHHTVMEELKRIIVDSEIMAEDDSAWPPPDRVGRQVRQIDGPYRYRNWGYVWAKDAVLINQFGSFVFVAIF